MTHRHSFPHNIFHNKTSAPFLGIRIYCSVDFRLQQTPSEDNDISLDVSRGWKQQTVGQEQSGAGLKGTYLLFQHRKQEKNAHSPFTHLRRGGGGGPFIYFFLNGPETRIWGYPDTIQLLHLGQRQNMAQTFRGTADTLIFLPSHRGSDGCWKSKAPSKATEQARQDANDTRQSKRTFKKLLKLNTPGVTMAAAVILTLLEDTRG